MYYQGKIDSRATEKNIISAVVENAEKNSKADIVLDSININKQKKKIEFVIKNYGNSTAKDITLELGYSTPGGGGQGGNFIKLPELPKGKTDIFEYDLFPYLGTSGFKDSYDEFLNKFISGERALIINVSLTYKWEDGLYTTGKYIISYHNNGEAHFFKI